MKLLKSQNKRTSSTLENIKRFYKKTRCKNEKKLKKVNMRMQKIPLTSQNSSPIGMSLSGVILNIISLLTND